MDSIKVIFTGGPCRGKTKLIEKTKEYFLIKGYNILVVPEAATNILEMGINFNLLKSVVNF